MKIFDAFHNSSAGIALLRWTLGILLLLHGIAKVTGGVGFIEGMLGKMGLPGFIAYGVYIGEVVAPILLLINRFVVPAALVIAVNMVFALVLVHTGDFFQLTQTGGWKLELQAFFLVSALVVALTAPKTGGK
ncbi:MAG: DoxX family protein [Burkholderiaceae bacterium]|nr:DoxX family protein [Burkholderiaceae bacterium]